MIVVAVDGECDICNTSYEGPRRIKIVVLQLEGLEENLGKVDRSA